MSNKTPWLCRQYNEEGWAFRFPVLTSIFFHIHERTCADNGTLHEICDVCGSAEIDDLGCVDCYMYYALSSWYDEEDWDDE